MDPLKFDLVFALKHHVIWPRHRRELNAPAAADAIIDHLRLCGWEFNRREPGPGHSVADLVSRKADPT